MATKVIKTPGQRLFEQAFPCLDWSTIDVQLQGMYEAIAAKHGLKPVEEHVPDEKPTDGELLVKAYDTSYDGGKDAIAAEFLRLRAERDGEPLPVTAEWLKELESEFYSTDAAVTGPQHQWMADRINQHRGVRPAGGGSAGDAANTQTQSDAVPAPISEPVLFRMFISEDFSIPGLTVVDWEYTERVDRHGWETRLLIFRRESDGKLFAIRFRQNGYGEKEISDPSVFFEVVERVVQVTKYVPSPGAP